MSRLRLIFILFILNISFLFPSGFSKDPNLYFHITKGKIYAKAGYYEQALTEYKKALLLAPTDIEVQSKIVECYIGLKQFVKAKEKAYKIVSLQPDYVDSYLLLGYVLGKLDEYDEAIKTYNKVLSMQSCTPQVAKRTYNNLATIYLLRGSHDEALSTIKDALTIDPTDIVSNITLSQIYEKKGQYAEALQVLTSLKEIPEDFTEKIQNDIIRLRSLINSPDIQ